MIVTIIGSFLPYLGTILGGPIYSAVILRPASVTNIRTNLSAFADFPAYLDSMNDRLRVAKIKYELPKVKALVGSETLDVFGSEQGVALLNDFNYRPRPVFQSYSAYNEFLNLANQRFYQGPKSPRFVLMKLQTIDGRIVAGDDSAALEFILRHYQPLLAERGYVLLKKRDLPNVFLDRSLVEQRSVKFSDRIDIPASDSNYWIQIAWKTNWRGKLQGMLYQPSEVRIELTDQDGSLRSYRLTQQIASTGFLLQPFLNETSDVVEALSGKSIPHIKSFRLLNESGNFAESFDYKLYSNPKFPTETTTGISPLDLKYWSLKTLPRSVKTSNKSATILVNEDYVFLAPAPSEILFKIPESAHYVQGYMGLAPFLKGWQEQQNRAAMFIELVDQNSEIELLRRTLAPNENAADRSKQFFKIALPPRTRAELRLVATIPAAADTNNIRTYWSDIQFE